MGRHLPDEIETDVTELEEATANLQDPIDDFGEQVALLSDRMQEVAAGFSRFDRTRRQLDRARRDVDSASVAANDTRAVGDD